MQRLKVMTIVGTRPEIIKLSRVINELDRHTHHILVHTGQNFDYELNEIFFQDLNIKKPDYFLQAAGKSAAETIGQVIIKIDHVFEVEQPDAILVYGDTNSCLSVISAKKRKIPIFHMEAGNRCFDQRVPEESNRKIVDHMSDVNMTISEHARRYLLAEGLSPETTFKIGSSMKEVFQYYSTDINNSVILEQLGLSEKEYIVVSIHREENVDSKHNLFKLIQIFNLVTCRYNKNLIVSTHPRTQLRLNAIFSTERDITIDPRVKFLKPFGFFDYIKLQMKAFCVLSDSGSITEDSSLLKFPAVTLRESHERPEGMDQAAVVMSGLEASRVLQAIDLITEHHTYTTDKSYSIPDYEVDNVSKKVVRLIMSYVDFINRTIWNKKLQNEVVAVSEMI